MTYTPSNFYEATYFYKVFYRRYESPADNIECVQCAVVNYMMYNVVYKSHD